ncbi:type III polyketide synthase [Lunatimonas salinarum]|uniref:type III polyketide synthase n=1 Tax=Lunatimonas salinarum TaxID=1774590 RepID=UPI001ADF804D|nr:type III polyketide synthase [Lunatimonas salinarum]
MSSTITAIGTAIPENRYPLSDFVEWAGLTHASPAARRKLQFLARDAGIAVKHMAINDFSLNGKGVLYRWNGTGYQDPDTAIRLGHFLPLATKLGTEAATTCLRRREVDAEQITHLIAVSCTGVEAPGLEIALYRSLNLPARAERGAVNFMGCYAVFHALKQADYICRANPGSKVLIVSVELCSLHFRNSEENDNLLSTVLFSDGAAAALIEGGSADQHPVLRLNAFASTLISEGKDAMGWHIGIRGFEMILSSAVPKHIGSNMRQAYQQLLTKGGLEPTDIVGYAIHPGGKNILMAFAEAIGCEMEDLQVSFDVMREHGNMSSATILFVLERILYQSLLHGPFYAAAFGPGLTVESGLFSRL